MLERGDERPPVELEKCENGGEPSGNSDKRHRDKYGQDFPEEIARARSAGNIYELLERKRSEDFILNLYELRYLELHMN